MAKAKPIPYTQEQLHEMFEERELGYLYWRLRGPGRWDIDEPAGRVGHDGVRPLEVTI